MERKTVGHIANTFGLRGVFKVALLTDAPTIRFAAGNKVEIDGKEYEVESFKLKNAHLGLLGLKGLDDINLSEKFIGKDIYEMVEPLPGTVFIDDLIGLSLLDKDGKTVGKVKDVTDMNSHDYLALDNGKYIPFLVGVFVEKPDYKAKTMKLTPLGEQALAQ